VPRVTLGDLRSLTQALARAGGITREDSDKVAAGSQKRNQLNPQVASAAGDQDHCRTAWSRMKSSTVVSLSSTGST